MENVKTGRVLMPETAQMVDELRNAYGAEVIDAAIAAGQKARKEFQRRCEAFGEDQARRWLARQEFPAGCFWAQEAGHEVGIRRL